VFLLMKNRGAFIVNFYTNFFVYVLVFGLVVAGSAGNAVAQKIAEQFKKPMPEIEMFPQAEFEKETSLYTVEISNDPALSYDIRVPKGWTKIEGADLGSLSVSDKVAGEIGKFFGPATLSARSYVQVNAVSLDHVMTAEQWFIQYLLEQGYNSQGLKAHDDNNAEALYVTIQDAQSYVVRVMARINGQRIVTATYYAPVERWHEEKAMATAVLQSFQFNNPVEGFAEEVKTYEFLDLSKVHYPASWNIRVLPIRSIDRLKAQLINSTLLEGGRKGVVRLDGRIDIEMVSIFASDTLEDEMENYNESLQKYGISMGEEIEMREDLIFDPAFEFADTRVYEAIDANNAMGKYELWYTIMAAGEYYYFVSLFTPARDYNYATWVRNAQAYKMVTTNVEPLEGSLAPL